MLIVILSKNQSVISYCSFSQFFYFFFKLRFPFFVFYD